MRSSSTLFFELPAFDAKELVEIYRWGFFPWYSEGEPITCVNPPLRCILYPQKLHIASRTLRYIRKFGYSSRINGDFESVIHHCATVPRKSQDGTWITKALHHVFCELHTLHYAYSFEVYCNHTLSGGLYGLWIGNVFYGESMFSLTAHASLVALANLSAFASAHNIDIIDCQIPTPHLLAHGAEVVTRERFMQLFVC